MMDFNRVNQKRLILFILMGWLILSLTCWRPVFCYALSPANEIIQVRLFQAYPPPRTLEIVSPFEMIYPVHRRYDNRGTLYSLTAESGALPSLILKNTTLKRGNFLNSSNAQEKIMKSSRFILKPLSPKGLGLKIPPLSLVQKRNMTVERSLNQSLIHRRYVGTLLFTVNPSTGSHPSQTIQVENHISLPEYVKAVVGSETGPHWPIEALKAQAVLTQTRLKSYSKPIRLNDTTDNEAYLGQAVVTKDVSKSVESVWGQVLTYQQVPISVFYHSRCGGKTTSIQAFGASSKEAALKPYLTAVNCAYCKHYLSHFKAKATHHYWLSSHELKKLFHSDSLEISNQDASGRPLEIKMFDSSLNAKTISAYSFWLKIGENKGWGAIPGSYFRIVSQSKQGIMFESTGIGHGVGLCQWGAFAMAQKGARYDEILAFYFPKTQVKQR
ncbi:MAG: SpoIID/LytB domain-containing protein [Cyanobacteria bacterium]|nr:SpoIID/LytB domain-containing protein [Cyanobacteriota bacterium]